MKLNSDIFVSRFGGLRDEQWLRILVRSYTETVIEQVPFPAFPDAKLQETFVGSSGESALQEAFLFYQDIKRFAARLGIEISLRTRILDFGCGWGRNYRFFLKDVSPSELIGVDVDPECVRLCREHFPVGQFEVCGAAPPLPFKDETFDIVYAYSVFSHLSENVALGWVREFSRILSPGGVFIATTLKEAHLDVWNKIRMTGDHWLKALPDFDLAQKRRDFQAGRFLYCGIGGSGVRTPDFYGEAIIPPEYARRAWAPGLKLIDYLDDPVRRPQALLAAQKPGNPSRKLTKALRTVVRILRP
jgi:SAM-dependent methyltransferase